VTSSDTWRSLDLLDFGRHRISVEPQQQQLMTTTYFEPKLPQTQRSIAKSAKRSKTPAGDRGPREYHVDCGLSA